MYIYIYIYIYIYTITVYFLHISLTSCHYLYFFLSHIILLQFRFQIAVVMVSIAVGKLPLFLNHCFCSLNKGFPFIKVSITKIVYCIPKLPFERNLDAFLTKSLNKNLSLVKI